MIINLVFCKKQNNKSPINLIFGDTCEETEAPIVEISGVISAYNWSASGELLVIYPREINGVIHQYNWSIFGGINVDYGINENLVYAERKAKYKEAARIYNSYVLNFNESAKFIRPSICLFKEAQRILWAFGAFWGNHSKLMGSGDSLWKTANVVRGLPDFAFWGDSQKIVTSWLAFWGDAVAVRGFAKANWGVGAALDKNSNASFESAKFVTSYKTISKWGLGSAIDKSTRVVWNFAMLPGGCGQSIRPPYKPPLIPDDGAKTVKIDLIFCKPPNNKNPINLIFGDDCQIDKHSISDKKAYVVKNTIDIFRTDNDERIKVFSVEIGANRQDYLWSGTLSLPYSELQKIADKPEIEININQYKFIVDVNEINIKKAFNSKLIELSVFSTTQRLNTIKAHKIDIDMSSNAIMSAQLHRDDLVTGFEFVNSDVDWMVPANLIEYDEANALDIISQFGIATNDTIVSHAYEKKMIMKPKYPSGDPVYSLPSSKLFDFSESSVNSDAFNAVVVSGENVGITAVIRKDGSAGEKIAPMIINKLITAEEAARRTGLNRIYNTADISSTIDVVAPLYPEAPQMYPSDAVRIDSDVGWIDSVSISAKNDGGAITVRHSFTIEKKVV